MCYYPNLNFWNRSEIGATIEGRRRRRRIRTMEALDDNTSGSSDRYENAETSA
jgi:hypothetical protein